MAKAKAKSEEPVKTESVEQPVKKTLPQMNKLYKKRNGFYYSDGVKDFNKPYPSVTKILGDVLAKPGLEYWLIREAVRVALEDPSQNEKEVMATSKIRNSGASTRGTGVHNIFAKMISGEEYKPYPIDYEGYIKGAELFLKEQKPEVIFKDKIIKSDKYEFAGSLDCVLRINGEIWLIDLKTGSTYPEHGLQLSAYRQCLKEEGIIVDHAAVLLSRVK